MSIQTQIDRINGEVTTQKNKFVSIEAQLAEALALLDGKAVETCTVTVNCPGKLAESGGMLYYSDGTGTYNEYEIEWRSTDTISVVKNSIIFINLSVDTITSSGDIQDIVNDGGYMSAFFVTGDGMLMFED